MSPVPEKFQAYGEAVCAFLSHATRREKAAVRQELMDHLTDHTQALLDAAVPRKRRKPGPWPPWGRPRRWARP